MNSHLKAMQLARSVAALIAIYMIAGPQAWARQEVLPSVSGEPSATPRAKAMIAQLDTEGSDSRLRIELPFQAVGIAPEIRKEAIGGRTQIGVARDIARDLATVTGDKLYWRPAGAGLAARVSVRSPGAAALRASITPLSVAGLEMRVAGADRIVARPVRSAELVAGARSQGVYWTPVTSGDEQTIELFVPDRAAAAALQLRIDSVSHLVSDPAKRAAKSTGSSGSCNQDVACVPDSSLEISDVSRSVAKIVYTSRGRTYACSATLVNDTDRSSQVPYLLTAAHCVNSAEAAATVTSFWFYERRSCNGDTPDPVTLTGGATLLFANALSDVALLRLNEPAPSGAYFAGIDPNPVSPGDFVLSLHHPRGDPMKVSSGIGVSDVSDSIGRGFSIAWMLGTTEPGSSGAGAFSRDSRGYFLRGTLSGGSASCESSGNLADESNRDYFARLDGDFNALGAYLLAGAAPRYDYAGLWTDPNDPGWGVSIVHQAAEAIAAVWFTHDADGEPMWTWISEGSWKSSTTFEAQLFLSEAVLGKSTGVSRVTTSRAGDVTLDFSDRDHLTLTVRLDGSARSYALERQPG